MPSKTSAGEDCHRGGDMDSTVTSEVRARAVAKKKESSCITNVDNRGTEAHSRIEKIAEVFGNTMKKQKENEKNKEMENEKETRKKVIKEKVRMYEQRKVEKNSEYTDREKYRERLTKDPINRNLTESVKKNEKENIRKKSKEKETGSIGPKEQKQIKNILSEKEKSFEPGKITSNICVKQT